MNEWLYTNKSLYKYKWYIELWSKECLQSNLYKESCLQGCDKWRSKQDTIDHKYKYREIRIETFDTSF